MTSILKVDSIQTSTGKPIVNATGSVLQVVSNVIANTQDNTNSQSFQDASLNCSITPTSSSSKILVMVNTQQRTSSSGDYGLFGLKRGSTDLESGKSWQRNRITIGKHYLSNT